jgi:hypothetical protein
MVDGQAGALDTPAAALPGPDVRMSLHEEEAVGRGQIGSGNGDRIEGPAPNVRLDLWQRNARPQRAKRGRVE